VQRKLILIAPSSGVLFRFYLNNLFEPDKASSASLPFFLRGSGDAEGVSVLDTPPPGGFLASFFSLPAGVLGIDFFGCPLFFFFFLRVDVDEKGERVALFLATARFHPFSPFVAASKTGGGPVVLLFFLSFFCVVPQEDNC